MLIDLNGMLFHLNIQNSDDQDGFKAEIVDEAFNFGVRRDQVHDLDGVAALVKGYSGVPPRTDVLSEIAQRLEDLHREGGISPSQDMLAADQTTTAIAG